MNKSMWIVVACTAMFCAACSSFTGREDVDTLSHFLDVTYKPYNARIDSFFTQKMKIDELQKDLNDTLKTITDDESEFDLDALNFNSYLKEGLHITEMNCIVVNNKTNLIQIGGYDDDTLKSNAILTLFSTNASPMDFPLNFWLRYEGKHVSYHHDDEGLCEDEVKEYTQIQKKEFTTLDSAKYLLHVFDAYYYPPKPLGDTAFEGGLLITYSKLYNINSKAKIGESIHIIENQDRVPVPGLNAGLSKDMDENLVNGYTENDIIVGRNQQLIEFYRIGK